MAAHHRLTTYLTIALCACNRPEKAREGTPAPQIFVLKVPEPTNPILVSDAFSTHRAVRANVRLEGCWSHAICARSLPLWAKSKMLEEFRLSSKEMKSVVGTYFQNDSYYVTKDAQLLIAHRASSQVANLWVERSGHRWSLWREGDVRVADHAEMLFVLQPGWIGNGPRTTWVAHEDLLRTRKLTLGEGPFVDVRVDKKALSRRLPKEVNDAHVVVELIEGEGAVSHITMNVTDNAESVAEKVRELLRGENGFVIRAATRDVLSGAEVGVTNNQVEVTIPVSAIQAKSMLALAAAYVGEDADP